MTIKPRARDLGLSFEGTPASLNSITDIEGIEVGYTTIIEEETRALALRSSTHAAGAIIPRSTRVISLLMAMGK